MEYLITFGFVVLDFLSGLTKAVAKKQLSSTKMREGLFHKVALLLCMLLGAAVDVAQRYLELGVHVPVGIAICVYIVLMETGSVLENLSAVNPELVPEKLKELFGGMKHGN